MDFERHCSQTNDDAEYYKCSAKAITLNVTKKHVMEIGAGIGMLGEDIKEFRLELPEMDSEDVYESTLNIGK